jgi:hypothetical protein
MNDRKMKKSMSKSSIFGWSFGVFLSFAYMGFSNYANAGVLNVTDLNLGDAMSITSVTNTATGVTATESYGESTLIPYSSLVPIYPDAGDKALVTPSSTYFDKSVTYSGFQTGDLVEFQFEITNNSLYPWRDFHFEIWNDDFTARQQAPWASPNPNSGNLPTLASDKFTGLVIHPNVATFHSFAGSGERHNIGEIGTYTLRMELYSFNNTGNGSFGLRQIATTAVPEPASMAIFGLGFSFVMAARRKRAKTVNHETPTVI